MFSHNEAENAAITMRPHVYTLEGLHDDKKLNFITFGCHGNAQETQKKVADLIAKISAQSEEERPDFILVLGDNFYANGVASATDPMFQSHFDDIYNKLGIPCFVILGNHDYNYHRFAIGEKGIARAMHQVTRSYLPETLMTESGPITFSTENKKAIYSGDQLDLRKLPIWNMPSRYYSVIAGHTQIFMVDSNTYAKDYLAFLQGDKDPATNQAAWFEQEMRLAREAGRTVMLAQHHPLFTPGSRAFHSDDGLYLEAAEKANLLRYLPIKESSTYGEILDSIYQQQGFTFDAIFAAHDHAMYYYNNKANTDAPTKCQMTAGGGGGKLQGRLDFKDNDNLCFVEDHGCVGVKCNITEDNHHRPIEFEIHPVQGNKLVFTSLSSSPLRDEDKESPQVKELRADVLAACDEYIQFLNQKQSESKGSFLSWTSNLSHGNEGVTRVNKILKYFNEFTPDTFENSLARLQEMLKGSGKNTHSLATILDKQLKISFNKTLDALSNKQKTKNDRQLIDKNTDEADELQHVSGNTHFTLVK